MEILLLLILIIDVFKSLIKLKKNNLKSNIYIYINIVPWIFNSPKITINSLSKNNFIKIT